MTRYAWLRIGIVCCVAIAGLSAVADTTYSLSTATPLLDADYYNGVDKNGAGAAPGRVAMFAQASKSAKDVAFWMVTTDFSEVALFIVDVGNTGSWRRLTGHLNALPTAPIAWTPDDNYVLVGPYRFDAETGDQDQPIYAEGEPYGLNDIGLNDTSTTSKNANNWAIMLNRSNAQTQIVAVPIQANGDLDESREVTIVTNFGGDVQPDWPAVAHDGSAVAFANFIGGGDAGQEIADISDNYVLANLEAIIAAPKIEGTLISTLAPTSTADPNVIAIRTNEDVDNFVHVPLFSQDRSLVLFTEDWNNIYTDDDFFGTLALADFDVMLSNSDGMGSDIRFAEAGNQFISSVTSGGVRVVYVKGSGTDLSLYITSLQTETEVAGDDVSNTTIMVDLGNGDEEVMLGDNAVQIPPGASEPVMVGDASGTVIELPPGQVVDFPSGGPQTVSVTTPTNPVDPGALPEDAPVDAIPVVREFGPSGTNFYPPTVVKISYTDAEVEGLNEASITPYLYNIGTAKFDIPVPESDIVERNTEANYIKFKVSHFSTYGLGAQSAPVSSLPMSPWAAAALVAAIVLGAMAYRKRMV